MQHPSPTKHGMPTGNPLASLLVVVGGIVAIATLIVLGFFAFVVLSAIILVAATIVGIRSWWLGRGSSPARRRQTRPGEQPARHVIEGEYRVVDRDRDQT